MLEPSFTLRGSFLIYKYIATSKSLALHQGLSGMHIWSAIKSKLEGRSDNEIKNYWHTHLKKHANHNSARETTEQHDTNLSSVCEANVAEKKLQDDNAYNHFGSLFLETCEDDSSSSVEWKHDYYDLRSPGTIKDLQGFWEQLCPLETLDLGARHEDMSFGHVFLCSYNDATTSDSEAVDILDLSCTHVQSFQMAALLIKLS
ncbi:hypothetical protein L1987_63021 [Smallanthus sonchifolius]|uniref:Uncharacterized protein n=1 Tax=Smallanthus sonchifolius TaxID=185202 RepID=A0ACB9CC32_9ASTR|nr:hypothetical protein L1987_63021 [Smallanthus sonchifolius]